RARRLLRAGLFSGSAGTADLLRSARSRLRARNPQAAGLLGQAAQGTRPAGMKRFRMRVMRMIGTLAVVAMLTAPALAETVQVAPGVQVTKRSYNGPVNEQPFFGLAARTADEKAEDEKFVAAIIAATGTREKAFEELNKRAWRAVNGGRFKE